MQDTTVWNKKHQLRLCRDMGWNSSLTTYCISDRKNLQLFKLVLYSKLGYKSLFCSVTVKDKWDGVYVMESNSTHLMGTPLMNLLSLSQKFISNYSLLNSCTAIPVPVVHTHIDTVFSVFL